MTNQEIKEEAEKIKDEIRPHALLWDDHNDEPTKEDHVTQLAIIHVKGIMKNTLVLTFLSKRHRVYKDWQSILTELKRVK